MSETEFRGYYPGAVGKITEVHAVYYHKQWGFDVSFETQVGRELSEFISEFQQDRDGLWVALVGGRFAGSVAIDGRLATSEGARLRWFIVEPDFQGKGFGKALLERALDFCKKKGYGRVFLWTFAGLEAARSLYERKGFRLCKEHEVRQWGQDLTEQMFALGSE